MTAGIPSTPHATGPSPKPAGKKPAAKKATVKKPAGTKKPAGKKSPQDINKSAEIRRVAGVMKENKQKPRPSLIMAELKKQGVVVSSPQVSMVLKRMGFRPRKRRKAGAVAAVPGAKGVRRTGGSLSVDDLLAAKRLVGHFGGTDRALAAIEALKKFES